VKKRIFSRLMFDCRCLLQIYCPIIDWKTGGNYSRVR